MIEILSDEHKNILKVIDALSKECDFLVSGKEIDKDFFNNAIDFVRNYADKFHHAKEEDILFVELSKNESEMHCNPMAQMLIEHDMGRNFVKKLEEGIKENNKEKVIENARGYAQLLSEHIFKEDNILYPMAEEALSPETKKTISAKFEEVGNKFVKEEEKYLLFANELEKRGK